MISPVFQKYIDIFLPWTK